MKPNKPLPDTAPLSAEMRAWLDELAPAEREALEQTWRWSAVAGEPVPAAQEVEAALARLNASLTEAPEQPQAVRPHARRRAAERPARRARRGLTRWVGAAAVLGLVLVAGLLIWRQPVRVVAPVGETLAVALPDGSTATLGSATALTYRRGLRGAVRRVRLEGEAFFEVVAAERPFVVATFNAEVRVLGTAFGVRAWAAAPAAETAVVLTEGAVRFYATAAEGQGVTLAPGQVSTLRAGQTSPTPPATTDLGEYLAWRQGGFVALNRPLRAVLAEVERRYGVSVEVEPAALAERTISLNLPRVDQPEAIVADIAGYWGYPYRRTPQGFVITAPAGAEP